MATHCSVLAWRIPGMGEPGGLPSVGSHRVGHDWCVLAAAAAAGCWQPSFCFPEGGAKTQVCGFSLAHRPWPVFWRDSLFRWACFIYCTEEQAPGVSCRVWGSADLALRALRVSMGQVGLSLDEVFLAAHNELPAGVLIIVSRSLTPLISPLIFPSASFLIFSSPKSWGSNLNALGATGQ